MANATIEQPLPAAENKKVLFIEEKWQYRDVAVEQVKVKNKEELRSEELALLDNRYEELFRAKQQDWAAANLDGNQSRVEQVKAGYSALKVEYEKRRGDIDG